MSTTPEKPNANPESASAAELVADVLRQESAAIAAAAGRVAASTGPEFEAALEQLLNCTGRVIVTGMGKMGCIARKAAATLCSTGTPAIFLHPSEAVHGDLGIVTSKDVLVVLSNSGETRELTELIPFVIRMGATVIGLLGNTNSSLAARCQIVIDIQVESEADPIAVAPTNSTTVALAMTDGLAVALMFRRGFTKEQFAIFHPGGNLGGKLLIQVRDLMHAGDTVPSLAAEGATLGDAVNVISNKGLGAAFIVDTDERVVGVLTDGDLRRILQSARERTGGILDLPLAELMHRQPKSIQLDALAAEALRLMEDNSIMILPVLEDHRLAGVIHLHDLIRAGLA